MNKLPHQFFFFFSSSFLSFHTPNVEYNESHIYINIDLPPLWSHEYASIPTCKNGFFLNKIKSSEENARFKEEKGKKGKDIYTLAGIFFDVDGFNEGLHESEKVFDTHLLLRILLGFGFFCLGWEYKEGKEKMEES